MKQLSFIITPDHIDETRRLARVFAEIPETAIITRETFGFGDFVEYILGPEGGEMTHYFCSDYYSDERAADLQKFVADQGHEWLQAHEGDIRPKLAEMGLVLLLRKPDYPEEIIGIDR